jgi:hypothetical protein
MAQLTNYLMIADTDKILVAVYEAHGLKTAMALASVLEVAHDRWDDAATMKAGINAKKLIDTFPTE